METYSEVYKRVKAIVDTLDKVSMSYVTDEFYTAELERMKFTPKLTLDRKNFPHIKLDFNNVQYYVSFWYDSITVMVNGCPMNGPISMNLPILYLQEVSNSENECTIKAYKDVEEHMFKKDVHYKVSVDSRLGVPTEHIKYMLDAIQVGAYDVRGYCDYCNREGKRKQKEAECDGIARTRQVGQELENIYIRHLHYKSVI